MRKTIYLIAILCLALLPMGTASVADRQPVALAERPDREASDAGSSYPALIDKIFTKDGTTYVTIDYIQWYQGEEANRVFRERERDPDMTEAPDGYYIVNDDPALHTYPVRETAEVLMQIYNRSGSWEDADLQPDERISLRKFRSLFTKNDEDVMKSYPYHITVADGKVVKIVQQFIP
ncbi:hypothetical protein [Cohnella sp. REN36]|uniref:hypothetical protein n=1 Tax=Cohnella sp. REN36 TaxID=2887347 RepID=UPI001D15B950|nr:hypothetical protein [Cohnella sp. REN36]MCC3377398.1 hypothetical protein [Cohnella sp. REN36]